MLGMMLALMASQAVAEVTPALNTLAVSVQSNGVCAAGRVSTSAQMQLAWTSTNFDSTIHEYRVYRDNILKLATSALIYSFSMPGLVYLDPHHQQTVDFNFRVDIVRKADSVALASMSASLLSQEFGNCVGAV